MPIDRPSLQDVTDLIDSLGYASARPAADQYLALLSGMLAAYDAVDTVEVPRPEQRYPRGEVSFPSAEEDPAHAWYVKVRIEGAASGPLRGRTVAIKDSIMIAGVPMMNGAGLLEGFVPDVDAEVVTRVLDAGATIVGKTACEYFCLSGGSHTNAHGPTHNPHRHGWSAGGSSSGSAVAVVDGEADLALGADQAGSIRMPASYSGLVGMKPTYGLVPYTGIAPIEPFFDHVGPMTATVADNALLLQTLAGPDGIDVRQRDVRTGDYTGALGGSLAGVRVGLLREGFGQPDGEPDVDGSVRAAAGALAALGAEVVEVSVPEHLLGPALWTPIAIEGLTQTVLYAQGFPAGRPDLYPTAMVDHLWANRHRVDELPPNVKLFTMLSEHVTRRHGRSYYGRAVNAVRVLRAAYDRALQSVDVLLMPTTPMKAQPLPGPDASVVEYCAGAGQMFANTCPFDVSHHPAVSVPCGTSDGLPVGMMLVGRHFDEATLYRVAHAYEQRDA
jgi:amidase